MFRNLFFLLSIPAIVAAYSFEFTNTPRQCQNLSISITGAGKPPYSVLIIPFGPTPLPGNVEVRKIYSQPFPGTSDSVSFRLNYPTNSQMVVVVSDSTAFGSGGTSVAATVQSSFDSSCFDATKSVSPIWVFSIEPPNQIVQCQPTRIWWDPATVQGIPQFVGIIPGGQSFSIPQDSITTVPNQGVGFSWTPNVRGGTTLIVAAGDNRGMGTGGSILNTVSSGITTNNTCLNANSPSSTPASPAGGRYPTSTNWSSSAASTSALSSGGNSVNVAAIVGGIVGGISFLIVCLLVGLFLWHRNRGKNSVNGQHIDLLQGDESDGPAQMRENQLPPNYQPEPFVMSEPTVASRSSYHDGTGLEAGANRYSATTSDERSHSRLSLDQPGSIAASSRKSGPFPRSMRPVNIVQHDDAGPSEVNYREDEDQETIELPPAYSNIKK